MPFRFTHILVTPITVILLEKLSPCEFHHFNFAEKYYKQEKAKKTSRLGKKT